jgi:tRNA-specific 2-thiouridylase
VVGLSGGVDSAVAALRLREAGCEVVAVTTKNFCESDLPGGRAAAGACCGSEAVEAARTVAAALGIPHRVLDVARDFAAAVIEDFGAEYRAGRTPNPCVLCNRKVRFPSLGGFARTLGADLVATGHYARLLEHPRTGLHVARGVDAEKDQAYYLHRLPPTLLERSCFPLGASTKEEVRAQARRAGLPTAEAPESQEICFVADGDRAPFVGEDQGPGEIVDRAGRLLGRHRGLSRYTVGQRRGLGLGGGPRRFVLRLEPEQNRLVVGEAAELQHRRLICDEAWLRDPGEGGPGLIARTRSRHGGCEVASLRHRPEHLEVELAVPDRAPAPGQSLVLYRGAAVVGGGRLQEVI